MTSKGSGILEVSRLSSPNGAIVVDSFSTCRKDSPIADPADSEADTNGLPSFVVFHFNQPEASRVYFSQEVKVEKNAGKKDLNLPERLSGGVDGLETSVEKWKSPKSLIASSREELYKFLSCSVSSESYTETQSLQSCRRWPVQWQMLHLKGIPR